MVWCLCTTININSSAFVIKLLRLKFFRMNIMPISHPTATAYTKNMVDTFGYQIPDIIAFSCECLNKMFHKFYLVFGRWTKNYILNRAFCLLQMYPFILLNECVCIQVFSLFVIINSVELSSNFTLNF